MFNFTICDINKLISFSSLLKEIEWGVIYLPRMKRYKFYFLDILKRKTAVCVYGEYPERRNKHKKCVYLR